MRLITVLIGICLILSFPILTDATENNVIVKIIDIPQPSINITNNRSIINIDGFSQTSIRGVPMLPVKNIYIEIPKNADLRSVEITVDNPETIDLTHKPLTPPAIATNRNDGSITIINQTDDFSQPFPDTFFEELTTKDLAGHRVVALRLYPLRYLPDNTLSYANRFNIAITYELPSMIPVGVKPKKIDTAQEEIASSVIINYNSLESPKTLIAISGIAVSGTTTLDSPECIIITNESLESSLQPLADWKTKRGTPTKIYTVEYINSTYSGLDVSERIKDFINYSYNNWGTGYVILGGNIDVVPHRTRVVNQDDYSADDYTTLTDLYYADLADWDAHSDLDTYPVTYYAYNGDTPDFMAEVYVGRLPASDNTSMEKIVDKILTYEKNPPSGTWYKSAILIGAYSNYNDDTNGDDSQNYQKTDEAKLNEHIKSTSIPSNYDINTFYEMSGYDPSDYVSTMALTEQNVTNTINEGSSILNSVSHGSWVGPNRLVWNDDTDGDGLCDNPGSGSEVSSPDVLDYYSIQTSLINGYKLPFAYFAACLLNTLDPDAPLSSENSFGESIMNVPNGGVIGTIGATRASWYQVAWNPPAHSAWNQDLDALFWQEFFNESTGNYRPGPSLYLSKTKAITELSVNTNDQNIRKNLMTYILLGDPEIQIWSDIPQNFTVTHDSVISTGITQVTVTAKNDTNMPVENALVALQKGTEVYSTGYSNSTGQITFNLNAVSTGLINVTVTKHNFIPNETEITVSSDSTIPLISAISTSNITNSSASIEWTTNENSDSRILYSINSDLSNGNWTNQTDDSTTTHTVLLTNLNASTQYYFKPYSMDASGNQNITAPTGNFVTNDTHVPPEIISQSPSDSTVINNETDVLRAFSININQTADVIWLINGTQMQVNVSVTSASYTNTTTYNDAGNYNITAVVSNVNGTVSTTWTWIVNNKNREPIWVVIPEWAFNEDETNATLDLGDYCTDPDGDDVVYDIVVDDSDNMTTTINTTTYIVTFTPSANWFGNTTFKYQANDSYISVNSSMHNVTVQSVNDMPIINSIYANTTIVNESESFEVIVTAFDIEDSTLNYQFDWQSNGTWGTNQTDNRSMYSYSVNGTYIINARVWDSNSASATNNSITITVNDITPPAQVIGLTNDTPTWKTVNLSWNTNTEPDHLGYAVYKNGTLIDTTTNTYYNVTGLAGYSSYEFNISALDDNTNFGANASVIVTTPVAPPKPVITAWYNNITNNNATEFTVDESISLYFNVTANQMIDSYSWYKDQASLNNNYDNLSWDTNYSSAGIWNITCVVENYNGTGNISWLVTINDIDQGEVPPSTSSGGSGGGSTGEKFENIILKDVNRIYVNKGSNISYMFDKIENDIQYVNFTALSNAGYISTVIEVLESTSTFVNNQVEGIVYKNINIWVGKAGFATDKNMADQTIGFRVEKKWLTENNIDSSTVIMNRYYQEKWNKLSTIQTGEDSSYIYFESSTPGFSPFAITGDVLQMEKLVDFTAELETPVQIESSRVNDADQMSNTSNETTFENNNFTWVTVSICLLIIASILVLVHLKNSVSK